MAVGFRKGLFGFNCGDVMEYIERSHKKFAEKEKNLSAQVESLSKELDLSNENYKKLNEEKEIISQKLNEFSAKYEEIERLSENIGKLYLVAQANAQAIMKNSTDSAKLSDAEVEKNLSVIDEAHSSLEELKRDIVRTSDDFVAEVDSLIASLNETKENIASNTLDTESCKSRFDEVYKSLT